MYNIAFAGTPNFSIPTLRALYDIDEIEVSFVMTQPDKPVGRKQIITPSPVSHEANRLNLPIYKPTNMSEMRDVLSHNPIDVCVVIAYGIILPQWFLDTPTHGCVNLHASLLPDLRGASPIQSALLKGYKKTGVTLQKIESKMDTGAIIDTEIIPVKPNDTYTSLSQTLSDISAELINKSLKSYLNSTKTLREQDHSLSTYCKKILKSDGRIDFATMTTEEIYNTYRAFIEWPGIWSEYDKTHIKWRNIQPNYDILLSPGEFRILNDQLFIGTKNGSISILELQLPGKKSMTVSEFINGNSELIRYWNALS